jgi:hypothetical protein
MKATGYVTVEPVWDGDRLFALRLGRVTQQRPRSGPPGSLVVKLVLDLPAEVFEARTVEARVPPEALLAPLEASVEP